MAQNKQQTRLSSLVTYEYMNIKIEYPPLILLYAIYLFMNFFVNTEPWRKLQ